MITFASDNNNDLYIAPNGKLAISSELKAIAQTCEQSVQTMLGELVLQGDTGIPNFQLIWTGAPNIAQAEVALRDAILNVSGVTDVTSLKALVKDNVLVYNATIQTIYGGTTLGNKL